MNRHPEQDSMVSDPLQHHGFIFVTEYDLDLYPSIFMPAVVFDHALSLLSDEKDIVLNMRDSAEEAKSNIYYWQKVLTKALDTGYLEHHAYNGEYLKGSYSNADNGMYQFKYLLGLNLLLPGYFLEIRGAPSYKRDSFLRCEGMFEPEIWEIVEKASTIRTLWPEREIHPYQGNAIPSWVQDIIGPDYFEESLRLINRMIQQIETK